MNLFGYYFFWFFIYTNILSVRIQYIYRIFCRIIFWFWFEFNWFESVFELLHATVIDNATIKNIIVAIKLFFILFYPCIKIKKPRSRIRKRGLILCVALASKDLHTWWWLSIGLVNFHLPLRDSTGLWPVSSYFRFYLKPLPCETKLI